MKRYILSGAPGAGKTALLRRLEREGFAVVEEAATDINALMIAEGVAHPHLQPTFIDDILALQLSRQARAEAWDAPAVLFDRSPVCTLALAEFLGRETPAALAAEVARMTGEGVYERQIFFVENLGFIANTDVRRITFEDTLRFEVVHAEVYQRLGYELVRIPAADVATRAAHVRSHIRGAIPLADPSPLAGEGGGRMPAG